MKRSRFVLVVVAAVAVLSSCSANVAGQLGSNEQLRTQVFDAIAANKDLAGGIMDKLVATDSTRIAVVDRMLANNEVAKQVIVRVAMNPEAIDIVIGTAVRDSAMRGHVLTLLKGFEMAQKMK